MGRRQRKKKNTLRGHRTHGAGNKKNHRGKGVRGGVGKAGSHKHKFSKYYLEFGTKRTLKARHKQPAVNIEFIHNKLPSWVAQGKAKDEGGQIIVDGKALGFGKVLGKGNITEKIRLENAKASKGAAKKIIAAGGIVPGAEENIAADDDEFEAEGEGEPENGEAEE